MAEDEKKKKDTEPEPQDEQTLTVVVDSIAIALVPNQVCQPKVPDETHPDWPDAVKWHKKHGTNPNFEFDKHKLNTQKFAKLDIIGSTVLGHKQAGEYKLPIIGYVVRNGAGEQDVFPANLLQIFKNQ